MNPLGATLGEAMRVSGDGGDGEDEKAERSGEGPVPVLLMRSILQLCEIDPSFAQFAVVHVLPRIVARPVVFQTNMWEGIQILLKFCFERNDDEVQQNRRDTAKRDAARILTLLPVQQLEQLLVQFPEWKIYLRDYAQSQPANLLPAHVRALL